MTSSRSHSLKGDFGIKLNTGTEIIEPSQKERLLGANLTNDFLWKDHLRDNKKSVISVLKTKNNALSMISHYSSFLVRKMIANGTIMAHIMYHIQLYGGCSKELISALQIQQNRAARTVCKRPFRTRTETLLNEIGWMTVQQMVAFYSIWTLYKTRQTRLPKYLHDSISAEFKKKTRFADYGMSSDRLFTTSIGQTSFIRRSIDLWNELPISIRQEESPNLFSQKLKEWVKQNF